MNIIDYIKQLNTVGFALHSLSPSSLKIGRLSVSLLNFLFVGDIEIRGEIPPGQHIFIANHSNWKDIFVHSRVCPPLRFMAAQSVMKSFLGLPGLYFAHFLGGFPVVGGPEKGKASIETAVRLYKEGNSLFIYPEGWAWLAGDIREFRPGALKVQKETGASIVPLYIKYNKYPKAWIYKLPFLVQILITSLPMYRKGATITIGSSIQEQIKTPEDLKQLVLNLRGEVL